MCNHNLTIKTANTLSIHSKLISENWIRLIKENIPYNERLSATTIDKLIHGFIKYMSSQDKSFDKSLFSTAIYKIVYKDISYDYFMAMMNYFEESCTNILYQTINSDELYDCLIITNHTYNRLISCISEEYFNLKDTTVIALVKLAELRDDITGNHLERTSEYASLLAKQLGLNEDYVKNIEKASLLHDIGKVGIKDSILLKPGTLTKEEFEEIKQHTIIGARTIYKIIKSTNICNDYFTMGINIALHHHEKYNGLGYPHNLKKDQIPLESRIFSLVDAYDVIVSKRPYKEAETHYEAIKRIVSDSGKHFDPNIVNAFLKVEKVFNCININHKELCS